MKKTMKMIVCLILVLGSVVCLGACGNKKETSEESFQIPLSKTGLYEIESMESEDGTVTSGEAWEDAIEQMGSIYIELYEDNTAEFCLYGNIWDMEFSEDKIWETDNKWKRYDFSVDDGYVTITMGGFTYTLAK